MPDEPLTLSTNPPTLSADGDYDAICAALRQSARGRWFLEEHARRSRNSGASTFIRATEPANALTQGEHSQQTHMDVLAVVERLQDLAWIMREHGLDMATCEHIEILASTILSTSWLRDPGDRRAQKLGEALGYLERRIDGMIEAAREAAKTAPFGEIAVPLEGALEVPRTEGVNEPSAESESVAAPSELLASGQMEPASIVSDSAAAALPVEPAAARNAREIATETTAVRVPTMWEPPDIPFPLGSLSSSGAHPLPVSLETSAAARPESMAASTTQPLPDDLTVDIDDELFAALPAPVLRAVPAAASSSASGSVPIASPRSDPLAVLNAMSDEEKIALFT
jgi:hypothetical protein